MNIDLFERHLALLTGILNELKISEKEKDFRLARIQEIFEIMKEENKIQDRFFQLSHEILSMQFLSSCPGFEVSYDSNSTSGCDLSIFDNYKIECVCSGLGDIKKNGIINYLDVEGVRDARAFEEIILSRLTQSLQEKKCQYIAYLNKRLLLPDDKYIIFLSGGHLNHHLLSSMNYGLVLNKILLGIDSEQYHINPIEKKIVKRDFTYRNTFQKYNGKDINCNLFLLDDYSCVSGIIFSFTELDNLYSNENTILFINPNAKNKIDVSLFKDMVYWKEFKGEYVPRKRGRRLIIK